MAKSALTNTGESITRPPGWQGIAADWSSDQRAFKNVSWGKAMMWIFLLSDTFIFSCFLLSYMTVRMSTVEPWPNPSEVFALTIGGRHIPLILIAIMTFILISSSGTMAMAVNFGYRRDRRRTAILMLATALLGATFVGMQAFEWTKLIMEGVRPWSNPWGAAQFGSSFFMITGFHGTHVTIGVIFLIAIARKVWRGDFDVERRGFFTSRKGYYEVVEITGLYWHFVDRVWVFIFAFFYLWWGRRMTNAAIHIEGPQPSLHIHVHDALASGVSHAKGQQHPIKLYLVVWGWLFVLSTCSYLVDYFGLHGYLRWSLILLFMVLKAGLIVAVFMHMAWERLALAYAILLPPVLVLVFVAIMVFESDYTHLIRVLSFAAAT